MKTDFIGKHKGLLKAKQSFARSQLFILIYFSLHELYELDDRNNRKSESDSYEILGDSNAGKSKRVCKE